MADDEPRRESAGVADGKESGGDSGPSPARYIPAELIGPIERLTRSFATELGATLTPVIGGLADSARRWLPVLSSQLDAARLREGLGQLANQIREAIPPNWGDMDADFWAAALEVMNEGIPLIWVPRYAIAQEMLSAASAEDRRAVLEQHRADIADDCSAVLSDVSDTPLLPLAGLCGDAAAALRAGHCAAAQALAASVFDTWLREAVRRGNLSTQPRSREGVYAAVQRQVFRVTGETRLGELKASGTLAPVLIALATFQPGGPVPSE